MHRIKHLIHEVHRRSLWQVLGVYVLASWLVYQVIGTLYETLGLPDWVPAAAVVLFLIGLPIVLATAFVQEGAPGGNRAAGTLAPEAFDPTLHPELATVSVPAQARRSAGEARPLKRVLTWNRAITAGVLAFAVLGVGVTGFMGMRTFGIGPGATLLSAGVLEAREPILLADFGVRGADTLLADAVTEALRVDLDQSRVVRLLESGRVRDALERMQRAEAGRMDEPLALEIAQRLGLKAVLAGDLTEAGGTFVLTARLIAPSDGAVLASFRETAADGAQVISAVDRISSKLRGKIGESLKTIRAREPLEHVTTTSLEALKKYSQALRAFASDPDPTRAVALLQEAVTLDSTFAMAWRKLGAAHTQAGAVNPAKRDEALARAYRYRDRLSERERYHTDAMYAFYRDDGDASVNAYRALLANWPDDHTALHNLAVSLRGEGDHEQAAELGRRAIAVDSTAASTYRNLLGDLAQLGLHDESERLVEVYRTRWPDHPQVSALEARLLFGRGDVEAAETRARAWRDAPAVSQFWRTEAALELASVLHVRGRLAESLRLREEAMQSLARLDATPAALNQALNSAFDRLRNTSNAAGAVQIVERALARYPLAAMPPQNRPYGRLAWFFASAGRPAEADQYLQSRATEFEPYAADEFQPNIVRAYAAMHAGRAGEALAALDAAYGQGGGCRLCPVVERAYFHDQLAQLDSALAGYQRYIDDPAHTSSAWWWLPVALERLAQLHDDRGDAAKAAEYYARFADLWRDADAELRPRVDAARQRLQLLVERRG
jgi:eukaryotic-like serine/threonine-protein kinase